MPELVRASSFGGVALHYDRFSAEDYGQPGHPISLYMAPGMRDKLEACFDELFRVAPNNFGPAKHILTAGAYVNRPGYHGQGRAFDLDGIIWENASWIATSFDRKPHLYLAIESVVRQHFGTVLGDGYNNAHKDHIHMDDSTRPGFERMSKSRVLYLQRCIFFLYGIPVHDDGVWGTETEGATNMVREELGLGSFNERQNWLEFLQLNAKRGFEAYLQSLLVA